MLIKNTKIWFRLSSFLFIAGLVLTPLHTKISGIAWFSFLFVCLFSMSKEKKIQSRVAISMELKQSCHIWLILALVAYLIRLSVQIYHDEFNDASNFNLRVLIIALFIHFLFKKTNYLNFSKFSIILPTALLLVGFVCFFMAIPFIKEHFTFGTNQIPWAAGITFLASVLFICMLQRHRNISYQLLGWFSLCLIAFSILIYGVRGSYFYIILLPFWGMSYIFFKDDFKKVTKSFFIIVAIIFIALFTFLSIFPDIYQNSMSRVERAYLEILAFIDSPVEASNYSVAARLFLWINALKYIPEHLLLGHGIEGTKAIIYEIGIYSKNNWLGTLNQLHSEYFQAIVSYGIFGLVSFLLYPIGLLIIAFKLRKIHPAVCVGLLGMVFLFLTSSLTNTNTYHNYFGTLFSLSVGLMFILCRLDEIKSSDQSV